MGSRQATRNPREGGRRETWALSRPHVVSALHQHARQAWGTIQAGGAKSRRSFRTSCMISAPCGPPHQIKGFHGAEHGPEWKAVLLPPPREKAYSFDMTDLLDRAVKAARDLPPATQDEIARVVLQLAGDDEPQVALTDDQRRAISVSKAAAARGEFATDEQVRAVWAKHSL